ncbi:MAG: monofunctional biosynthetic peptidoglycan transglycosylase [Oligoflexia bacterium]|nr:monofunctional biosynthetic peptidoglycan transglycosylase [Oligoflexia bacterium]
MFFLLKSTILKILASIGALTVLIVLGISFLVAMFFMSLPDVGSLKGCLTTKMNKVYLCDKNPSFVNLEAISPMAVNAIIVSEDASFFDHDGIDAVEIKESIIKNITKGRFARGGSTITQQLVKNVFLSPEKSLVRKAQEVYLAFKVEELLTKKRILTLYLNVVEFGPEIFGIQKAAQYYFNKNAAQLLPEEGAFLAFLLPNPKKYHQSFEQKQLTEFANKSVKTILHKMYRARKLTDDEYKVARKNSTTLFGQKAQGAQRAEEETEVMDESTLDQIIEQEDFKLEQTPEQFEQAPLEEKKPEESGQEEEQSLEI